MLIVSALIWLTLIAVQIIYIWIFVVQKNGLLWQNNENDTSTNRLEQQKKADELSFLPPTVTERKPKHMIEKTTHTLSKSQLRYLDKYRAKINTLKADIGNKKKPYYRYGKIITKEAYQSFHDLNNITKRKAIAIHIHSSKPEYISIFEETNNFTIINNNNNNKIVAPSSSSSTTTTTTRTPVDATLPSTTWVLSRPLWNPTRNHDTVILEEEGDDDADIVLINILGRHNRNVEYLNLLSGHREEIQTSEDKKDPSGMPLNDLNHVVAIVVDSIKGPKKVGKEIWLPCGFHGDEVNSETSTEYVRIVNVETGKIRVGPKLPKAGGACTAAAISILPNEPPMICSFGGTDGHHDSGIFLKETQCYDRIRNKWWTPFGTLPYGMDHGSLAMIPPGVCQPDDPAKIFIFNFRTEPYGDCHAEILAHDMPYISSLDDLKERSRSNPQEWYIYHNDTQKDEDRLPKDIARDASGTVVVEGGRYILNFGGTYHYMEGKKRVRGRFSMIRELDICEKEWNIVGDLGLPTFALQTAASEKLQLAFTCGGEFPSATSSGPWCFATHFSDRTLVNRDRPLDFLNNGSRS